MSSDKFFHRTGRLQYLQKARCAERLLLTRNVKKISTYALTQHVVFECNERRPKGFTPKEIQYTVLEGDLCTLLLSRCGSSASHRPSTGELEVKVTRRLRLSSIIHEL
jgi:hypothetical protein